MDQVSSNENLRPLSLLEMIQVEGGALIPWTGVFIAVGAAALTNLPEIVDGFMDGWNGYR